MEVTIAVIAAVVSLASAAFTAYQAHVARKALDEARFARLFSAFDIASQATLERPDLLYDVHGLDRSVALDEARCLAYLSLVLDGFQYFYTENAKGKSRLVVRDLLEQSTFLNRILRVPENRQRWDRIKEIYYGSSDRAFINAIDEIIMREQSKSKIRDAHQSSVHA